MKDGVNMKRTRRRQKLTFFTLILLIATLVIPTSVSAEIAASHVYHNHMPNFWPYYDTSKYSSTPIGGEIRYMYDGQVIDLKNNPPSNYTYYLPNGSVMPHDDLVSYYSHHAKQGAYLSWPWSVANALKASHPSAQMQVTMSGSLINNVNSFMYTNNVPGYNNVNWGQNWKNAYNSLKTPNGNNTLDLVHFSGHHSMGPLVGNEYLLKDLLYQNATLAQPYFLGDSFKSSKGFFPTELGFSERIIPVLEKLGIEWSVIGNNHFSRTLTDYPLLNDPGKDTLVSPPNRADLQNTSNVGSWISQPMFNEQQVTHNKFPFASTPHWVKYVNPDSGKESKIVGVPVAQAESWEEGYQGSVTAKALKPFEGLVSQKQFFVIAHDGDNSSGRAGDEGTWRNAANVTYSDSGVKGMGISEYLKNNTPAANDVVHVQDGSWIDTRDSSSDPQWHHWKLPFGIWKGQFADFNRVNGTNYAPKKNLSGVEEGMTVSFEYGYHYLERNFALLQAALNRANTAEQIWLDEHPNYWSPTTALDKQITYSGNQLNPWMMSYPVKGDASRDYAGGANPAELAWYFLTPALDSGFGYYDENQDDSVKPTLSFNQSLYFSKPYTEAKADKDRTGPSVWWPQRWPYNPGSANTDKSQGWTLHYYDTAFAVYTYAFDLNEISDIKVKIRKHTNKSAIAADNTFRVYDPAALQAQGVANIDASRVGEWVEYSMTKRDLQPDINGVAWQASSTAVMQKVPAQETGDLYFSYIKDYRDELLDYYIEAVDSKGNVTKTDIQQVYVGAGTYTNSNGKIIEDVNGTIQGTYPFLTDKAFVEDTEAPTVPTNLNSASQSKSTITLAWTASQDNVGVTGYEVYRDGVKVGTSQTTSYTDTGLTALTAYTYTVKAFDSKGNLSDASAVFTVETNNVDSSVTIYYKQGFTTPYIHYRPVGGTWTTAPGVAIPASEVPGYNKITLTAEGATGIEAVFNNGGNTWDNNGSKNYVFPIGISTYTPGSGNVNGAITSGAPQGPDTIAPTAPEALTVSGKTLTSVNLTWTASTDNVGVKEYEIYRNGSKIGTATSTSYADNGLTPNTTYNYYVKAKDAAGNLSAASQTVAAKTDEDTSPPSTPAGLAVSSKTESSVKLTWNASTDNIAITGYNVYRDGVKVGTATTTSYTDSGLNADTSYTYRVQAFDIAGNMSEVSSEVAVKTNSKPTTNSVTIYYKQGYTTPYIHYRPVGGAWTTAPGVPMSSSEIGGYYKFSLDIGNSTALEAVFNNGSGTWDNNNSKNYVFPVGTSTYTPGANNANGTITAGAPLIDNIAPSVPANLSATAKTHSTVNLAWSASTDNVAVTGYDVYRNEVKIGTASGTTYADSGLAADTSYNYTVKAKDAAGNTSAASAVLTVKTDIIPAGNTVTVYYKKGFTTPYIHYRPVGGTWTTAPGTAIPASEVNGYHKFVIDVGSASGLEAVFNNGSGTWDNNNSKNYVFPLGTSTYTPGNGNVNGTFIPGSPEVDTQAPSTPTNLSISSKSSSSITLSWSASTDNVGVAGYEVYRNGSMVSTVSGTSYADSGLSESTAYSYFVKAKDAAGNVSAESASITATTDAKPLTNTITVYYKRGYTTPYIHYRPEGGTWTSVPGVVMSNSEHAGYSVFTIDLGTATRLEAVFNNGSGTWDNNYGNNYFFPMGTITYTPGSNNSAGSFVTGTPSGN